MLSKISIHLRDSTVKPMADWIVLGFGVLMLTAVIVSAVVAPATRMQAESDLMSARESAAL